MLKKEIQQLLIKRQLEVTDLQTEAVDAKRKLTKLKSELESSQSRLSVEVDHLYDIRKAIETVVALRYPDVTLETLGQFGNITATSNLIDESEELLALRHIYKLTEF